MRCSWCRRFGADNVAFVTPTCCLRCHLVPPQTSLRSRLKWMLIGTLAGVVVFQIPILIARMTGWLD